MLTCLSGAVHAMLTSVFAASHGPVQRAVMSPAPPLAACWCCCCLLPQMRVVYRLSYASTLEARQHSLLADWQGSAWVMFLTWLVVHIYSFIRYNYYGGTPWQHVTLWVRLVMAGAQHIACGVCTNRRQAIHSAHNRHCGSVGQTQQHKLRTQAVQHLACHCISPASLLADLAMHQHN